MASVPGYSSDTSDVESVVPAKLIKAPSTLSRARTALMSPADDVVAMDPASGDDPSVDDPVLGSSDRKYSFNALLAAGILGFVVGRICAR